MVGGHDAPCVQTVHEPVRQTSFVPHEVPSVRLDQAEVLLPGWQLSHAFAGSIAPLAMHALPMKQKPALSVGVGQAPVAGMHAPTVWQASGAVHVSVLPAVQTPATHVSLESHLLPSLHVVPLVTAT